MAQTLITITFSLSRKGKDFLLAFYSSYCTVTQFGNRFKVVFLRLYSEHGYEQKNSSEKGEAGNDEKLVNNLCRTKARIYELAYCNEWEYFVTLTLDKTKYNRYDLQKFKKDISQFIRDKRKKHGANIRYMLIPERHKDGAWHMHGFFAGLPIDELREFTAQERLPEKIRNRISKGKRVFTWTSYERKFGFSDIEFVENHEAASGYMTKYVTKEALTTIKELNAHCFYASQGLKSAERIAEGFAKYIEYDYSNEYCAMKWCDNLEDALKYIDTRKEQI